MDYFSVFLNMFYLVAQSVMHILFAGRLTGKTQKLRYVFGYLFFLCLLEWAAVQIALAGMFVITLQLLVLCGMNHFVLGNRWSVSGVTAILAIYISQLSFGTVNSVEALLFPGFIGKPILYLFVFLAALSSFTLCIFCYAAVLRLLSLKDGSQLPYMGLLLFPGLFFFIAELYILQTSYSALPAAPSLAEAGKHVALLLLQALGLGTLFCTLYAYRHICRSFQTQAALASLSQAARAQKVYIAEAQMRYEQTKIFRHDIKNHLSVLDGLLSSGQSEEGRRYLKKLEAASASLSFPYQTGNPVVDILLSEKLGLAKTNGIAAEVSLILPKSLEIDDFDLCVIFANALDNAIHACQSVKEKPFIRIIGQRQGDFYMLEFENTCSDEPLPPAGTGLSSIKAVTEKYHGAMLVEKEKHLFSLNVLLNS